MTDMINSTDGRSCTVLVVEDETLIRMMLVDELENSGFEVIEAENADDAVVKLKTFPAIEMVVTDIRMPGSIDGIGLATWMRENRSTVPIIITSGFATPPDIAAINPFVVKLLAKPYAPQAVAGCLFDIMARSDTSEPLRP